MKELMLRFLKALDDSLIPLASSERLNLYHIGRSALVWKYGFSAATEDIDVVSPHGGEALMAQALQQFGKGTDKAKEYRLYLERVPAGLPPTWEGCYRRATEVVEKWSVIRLFHLEDHDFAVTKLKRFWPKDQEDLRSMCDMGLLLPETLQKRLDAAYPFRLEDGKDDDDGRVMADKNVTIVLRYLTSGYWR